MSQRGSRPLRLVIGDELKKIHEQRYCLHPKAPTDCSKIIGAHTVQKKRMLARIAQHGHVYGVTRDYQDHLNGAPIKRWGIHKASTRPFLCSAHDATFAAMEKDGFEPTREHCFLLAYRALLVGLYVAKTKEAVANLLSAAGATQEADRQREVAWFRERHVSREKDIFDKALVAGDASAFHFYVIEFERCPDILGSSLFFPDVDFHGRQLQPMTLDAPDLQAMTFSLVATGSGGAAVFGWSQASDNACRPFIQSLAKLDPEQIPSALVRLTFEYCENSYFSPVWWEGLDPQVRKRLQDRFLKSFSPYEAHGDDRLAYDGHDVVSWTVTSQRWLEPSNRPPHLSCEA